MLTSPSCDVVVSIPGEIKANCELNLAISVAACFELYPRFVTLFIKNKKG
uniref:Uncharacterized protein n=1 Tax=Siphoviridae sp. ctRcp9 TaxID=2825504 RepID=A0A8S5PK56_9CAUD|nr:MAG TPA: hypothetical protein [Siphoviridae sp. ctRcp9]